jgi:hypothetical protein
MIIHSTAVEFTTGHFSCQAKRIKIPPDRRDFNSSLNYEKTGKSAQQGRGGHALEAAAIPLGNCVFFDTIAGSSDAQKGFYAAPLDFGPPSFN